MKIFLGFIILLSAFSVRSQSGSANDSAIVPYWIEMMKHPEINLFRTQRAFEIYWKDREIKPGSGYKVFKRWEYMAKLHSDGNGTIHYPLPVYSERPVIKKDGLSRVGVSGISGFDDPVSCYNDSFWMELGPNTSRDIGRINCIAFHPADSNIMLCGAASGGLWQTHNGGESWSLLLDSLPTLGVSAIAYDYSDPDIIYIGTGDKAGDAFGYGLYKSTDGGKSWFPINKGIPSFATVVKIVVDPVNPDILLIASNKGVFRSVDKGANWKMSLLSYSVSLDLVINEKLRNIVYLSGAGSFFKSTDSGKSFIKVTKGLNLIGNFSSIACTVSDSSFVYFLLTDYTSFLGLYRSTNFGDSFTLMSNSPNIMGYEADGSDLGGGQAWYCKDIAVNPLNRDEVYVGGVNLWKSVNGGKNWSITGHWSGNKVTYVHADIHSLEFMPLKNILYATNDGGVYKLKYGKTWTPLSKGLGVRQTYKLSTSNTGRVLAGYQDNGTDMTASLDSKVFSNLTGGDGMDNFIDYTNPKNVMSSIQLGKIYKNNILVADYGVNGINEYGDWITPFLLQEGNQNIMFAGYHNIWKSTNMTNVSNLSFKNICDANAASSSNFVFDVESSPADNNLFFFARDNGTIFKSSNVNATQPYWINITSKKPQTGLIRDIQCHYTDTSTLFIAIENRIYKSVNGGNGWVNFTNGLPDVQVYSLVLDSSSRSEGMYCGTSSGVYYRDSLLKKWVLYKTNFPENVKVLDLEISYNKTRKSSNRLIAGTYGRGIWAATLNQFENEKPMALFGPLSTGGWGPFETYTYNRTCPGKRLSFYDSSEGLGMVHKWIVTPNTFTSFENNDSSSVNSRIYFNKPGSYSVSKVVKNCMGNDTFVYDDLLVYDSVAGSSCHGTTTQVQYAGDFGITYLSLGGTYTGSKNTRDGGEYQNFVCNSIYRVKPDRKYSIAISINNNAFEYIRGYIDYNNDGVFSETTELILSAKSKGMYSDSVYISGKSLKHKLLRMRLISDYMPIDTGGCPVLVFGHTNDYSIVIEGEDQQDFKADIDSVCIASPVLYTDLSTGMPISWQWDFGNDANPRTASGAGPHRVVYTGSGYKSVKLIVDNKFQKVKDSVIFIRPNFRNRIARLTGDSVLCPGEVLALYSQLDSLPDFKYSWSRNGVNIGISSKNLFVKKAALHDSGIYILHTSDDCYTDTSNPEIIYVEALPDATFQSLLTTGYSYSFTPLNKTYKEYLWDFGNGNSSSLIAPSNNFVTPGKYRITLVAKTSHDCVDSSASLLDIKKNTHVQDDLIGPVQISPNPVKDKIHIQFRLNTVGKVEIEILNADGRFIRSVYTGDANESLFGMDCNLSEYGLKPGVYLLNVRVNLQDHVFRIILQ